MLIDRRETVFAINCGMLKEKRARARTRERNYIESTLDENVRYIR